MNTFPTFAGASSVEVRRYMSEQGWSSNDRITNQGWGSGDKYGYSIWFERYDWHGKRTLVLRGSSARYHAHTSDLSKIDDAVRKAALRALRAWAEFPDCFPVQNANYELIAQEPIVLNRDDCGRHRRVTDG